LLAQPHGVHCLLASLMYGSGLRLMEALRLRVKNLDNTGCVALRGPVSRSRCPALTRSRQPATAMQLLPVP
jgi:site-specific recombinase XerD